MAFKAFSRLLPICQFEITTFKLLLVYFDDEPRVVLLSKDPCNYCKSIFTFVASFNFEYLSHVISAECFINFVIRNVSK